MGVFFSSRDWETSRDLGKDEQSIQDLRLGQSFTFQQDNNPKHTAKTMQERLRDKALKVLEWPSQSSDLNPIRNLWKDLKIAVQKKLPIQPDRA